MKKYRILVYKCGICDSLVGVLVDERNDPLDTFDLEEHCLHCDATVEDFKEVGIVEVDAETLIEAIDKAIEIIEKEVDSDEDSTR